MDPLPESPETVTMTEEELEARQYESLLAGKASGLEEATQNYRRRAGEAYGDGDEPRAKLLREVARELEGEAKKYRNLLYLRQLTRHGQSTDSKPSHG